MTALSYNALRLRTEHVEALDDRDGLATVARALLDNHLRLLLLLDFATWQLLHLLFFSGGLGAYSTEEWLSKHTIRSWYALQSIAVQIQAESYSSCTLGRIYEGFQTKDKGGHLPHAPLPFDPKAVHP